jgi:hypothetical protein
VPEDILSTPLHAVGLLGPSMSMKSHFLAAAFGELTENQALAEIDDADVNIFATLHPASRDRFRSSLRLPIDEGQVIRRTEIWRGSDEVAPPYTLRLEITDASPLRRSEKSAYLAVFDAPGEKLTNQADQATFAPYLTAASALVVFVDPMGIASLRPRLPARPDARWSRVDADAVTDCAHVILEYCGARRPLPTPVAVVISKADLLATLPEFAAHETLFGRDWFRYPAVSDHVSDVAREFLGDHAPAIPVALRHYFDETNIRYFFASGTGCEPNEDDTLPHYHPWGCLDVVVWLLRALELYR